MQNYQEKQFNIPKLKGISAKNIEEHLKLYSGYVKHTNLILDSIKELSKDRESNTYQIGELRRRLGFEFDGMRNHEYYFSQLEGGAKDMDENGDLAKAISEGWGSVEDWLAEFKHMAKTRGVGWAILYYDPVAGRLLNAWIDEQQLGHLVGLQVVLALDMWEHSFVADYQPSGKGQYIDDFFENLNWDVVEENFSKAQKS